MTNQMRDGTDYLHEVGPASAELVQLSAVNLLSQTRTVYAPEGLEELALTMLDFDEDGSVNGLLLVESPMVGRFDFEHAESYLSDLNQTFGSQHSVDDLIADKHGLFNIAIYGHRRTLAMRLAATVAGIDQSDVGMSCVVRDNIAFDEAYKLQILENIHDRPSAQEEAVSIANYFQFVQSRMPGGKLLSAAECARQLNLGETKVRHALKFSELPAKVKELVSKGVMTYTDGVVMHDIWRAYRQRAEFQEDTKLDTEMSPGEEADHRIFTFAMRVINRRGRKALGERFSQTDFLKMVRGEVFTVMQDIAHDGGMYVLQQEAPRAQRAMAVGQLTRTVITLMNIVQRESDDPDTFNQAVVDQLFGSLEDDSFAQAPRVVSPSVTKAS